jgi:hypothetical protein
MVIEGEPLENVSQSGNSNIVECLIITCSRSEEMYG